VHQLRVRHASSRGQKGMTCISPTHPRTRPRSGRSGSRRPSRRARVPAGFRRGAPRSARCAGSARVRRVLDVAAEARAHVGKPHGSLVLVLEALRRAHRVGDHARSSGSIWRSARAAEAVRRAQRVRRARLHAFDQALEWLRSRRNCTIESTGTSVAPSPERGLYSSTPRSSPCRRRRRGAGCEQLVVRELDAGTCIAVVVDDLEPGRLQVGIQALRVSRTRSDFCRLIGSATLGMAQSVPARRCRAHHCSVRWPPLRRASHLCRSNP